MRGTGLVAATQRELAAAFAFAAILTVFVNLASLVVPLYDMQLYDRILLSRSMDSLAALSVFCLLGMGLYAVLEFLRSSLFLVMGDRLARRFDVATLRAALARSLDGEPGAAAQALRDLNDLRNFVIGSAVAVPLDLMWSPALLAVLTMLHPLYGLYGAVCALVLLGLSLANDRATRTDLADATAAANRSLSSLAGTLRNGELLDGLGLLPGLARRWLRSQGQQQEQLDRAGRRAMAYTALSRASRLLMQGGIIALGVVLVVRHQASPGSMMGATLLVAKLLQPFEVLVSGWRQWVLHAAAWKRVAALLGREGDRRAGVPWGCATGRLMVAGLAFSAEGRRILDDVSFTVEPGEALAITGPSAAGKSTLIRLILGLASPDAGTVTLDGRPTALWQREDFGRHVGYLPQAVSLLDGTVFDNIARMGATDAEAVVDAARRAGVHEMIGRLPLGYDTWVGGDSFALSGGQRQRIALARALYGRPKLLLLDEPNSNLDHLGDDALGRAIAAAKQDGAAVVIITHRPAILDVADKLLVLRQGRVERLNIREAPLSLVRETP
ncbi:MAG: type I secretion system permease/ATPase [Magnetospirillum sp.]|nr:type I secretion system permease/ATPase [Magnetospirillum sp.]